MMSKTLSTLAGILSLSLSSGVRAQYPDWKHEGKIFILTTPEGADLPASAEVSDFPLLVRLHRDFFPFDEADATGADIRFSSAGAPLAHEIENWDPGAGVASIWVRVPMIRGNAQQQIKIHWGNSSAKNASDGRQIFNASNGFVGVWHMGDEVRDVLGKFDSQDKGTSATSGIIGGARLLDGQSGVSCGEDLAVLPTGGASHSTQAWFRPDSANGRVVCWGNEKRAGKVQMNYRSPSMVRMDCYFSSGDVRAPVPEGANDWIHAVHTYEGSRATLYINGEKQAAGNPRGGDMNIEQPARMWIGGWYNRYDFAGAIDEVRLSSVARSADWVRLEYENQKAMQTLVGPVVQEGSEFAVAPERVTIDEGGTIALTAMAGGARKIYWSAVRESDTSIVATDRLVLALDAGRVTGDQEFKIRVEAVYDDRVQTIEVPVTVNEALPEPEFVLKAPANWDGRETIAVRPEISNLAALQAAGVGDLDYQWTVSGLATIKDEGPGKLVLHRAQNSGPMTVTLSLSNGGDPVTVSADVTVLEPEQDAWVSRAPADDEMPVDGQFYARNRNGHGIMHCRGTLKQAADEVFLRVFANDQEHATVQATPGEGRTYALAAKLDPKLVKYRIEFGIVSAGQETILHRAGDIVCGDAYLIEGQSNALATDTREESPRVTNEWLRSYGRPQYFKAGEQENLWCQPVWKANNKERKEYWAELGWWGMELGKRLVEKHQVPIFILNAAKGGTRIDQHQRNDADPTDLDTIYGRMLWRLQAAKLTHGIRAVIWHQGENDQGAAGPDGGYGWETYQRYFIEMSADWKRDLPNLSRYYVYQIWPNACSMGGGNGDMLREKQRTLPHLFSNMEILSTVGVRPPGGCHFPLEGWEKFTDMVQPLIARDFYGFASPTPLGAPNLRRASFTNAERSAIALEFDQAVVWDDERLASQFHLGDVAETVVRGEVAGEVLTLTLNKPTKAKDITYLKETSWDKDRILMGKNGIAALTFCKVPVAPAPEPARGAAGPSPEDAAMFSYYLGYRDAGKIAADTKQKPSNIDAFMNGIRVALDLETGTADIDSRDFKNGLGIGARIVRFAKERFPTLDRKRIADGLGAGLAGTPSDHSNEELEAAVKACAKFVRTPTPPEYAMLGEQAPPWEVGPWHQLPEDKASLDITDFRGKVLYLYCFQSWCPGCHSRGFPTLQKVSRTFDGDEEVAFVAVQTVFEDRAEQPVNTFNNLKKVAAKFELTIPFAQSGSREDKSKLMRAYKTRGTPWTIIIDKKGVIRYGGFHIDPDEAARLIKQLKAEEGQAPFDPPQ